MAAPETKPCAYDWDVSFLTPRRVHKCNKCPRTVAPLLDKPHGCTMPDCGGEMQPTRLYECPVCLDHVPWDSLYSHACREG